MINLKLITEADVCALVVRGFLFWMSGVERHLHLRSSSCLLIFLETPGCWMPSNISWGGSNLGPESGWLFFFYFRKIKDYRISLSQDKSKFNYHVIQPGKLQGQVYHFIHFPSVLVWFFLPQSFFCSRILSVQSWWNIGSLGMNSRHFPFVCFSQITQKSGMVCSSTGMVFCGDGWVFGNVQSREQLTPQSRQTVKELRGSQTSHVRVEPPNFTAACLSSMVFPALFLWPPALGTDFNYSKDCVPVHRLFLGPIQALSHFF